ncbi:MAG: PQQ-binding-like beta-propeller repeat protein [Deltaproteobacteria bacterium]|nr:PQQ-binding-like beta-propeller repeat protein [Deltaproteobacteria bacterium]
MKPNSLLGLCLSAILLLAASCSPELQPLPEWNQFRGPTGLGISAEVNLPETWNIDGTNVRWVTDLQGLGNSSPIVSQGRVFLTAASDDPEAPKNALREVFAYDLETGVLQWKIPLESTPKEKVHFLSTLAPATPVADENHLWVYIGSHLAKLDHEGQVLWKKEVDPDYWRTTRYGVGSSPVLVAGLVVLFQDQESSRLKDRGWLAAFDQDTGEEKWRHEWTHTCCSYATPLVYDDGEILQILVPFSGEVASYVAETGERLWSHPYKIHQIVPSLALEGDLLCATGGGHSVNGTACLRLTGSGRDTTAETLWTTPRLPATMASPVLYNGRLYVLTQKGVLVQYDPETGAIQWQQRLSRGMCQSSLVAGDDKIYAVSRRGPVAVVAAQDELQLIAENMLDGGLNSTPAIADGCLLLRAKKRLFCVANPRSETP